MHRRTLLRGVAVGATGLVAGCLGGGGSQGGQGGGGNQGGSGGQSGGGGQLTPTGPTVDSLPAPVQGDPNADVTVMVFEDYACPHCREYEANDLPKLEQHYVQPGTIRYEHHDFPIPVDPYWSWVAASAARGVQDHVGDAAFFTYTSRLFQNQDRYSLDLLASLASDVGADGEAIRTAGANLTYKPVIQADRQKGLQMNLDGTPEVYVNGQKTADHGYDTIASAIEQARS